MRKVLLCALALLLGASTLSAVDRQILNVLVEPIRRDLSLSDTQIGLMTGLAFALGMYLPMELNSPLVLGAAVAWLVKRSTSDEPLAKARHEKGTLIASGFIAGGALVGVLAALLKFVEDSTGRTLIPDLTTVPGAGAWLSAWGNWIGLAVFLALAAFVYRSSKRETLES